MKLSIETTIKVFDDTTGMYVSVSPDADGLGLCRIQVVEGNDTREIHFPWGMAQSIAQVLGRAATQELEKKDRT
jgi:hypothetical protein